MGKKVYAKISAMNLKTLNLRGDFFFFFSAFRRITGEQITRPVLRLSKSLCLHMWD